MDISFELYKIFYYAADAGSFSVAAQKLYITQSAVSQAIQGLEQKLGQQLFYRKSRKIALTKEGEILFTHVHQAFNFIKSAENKLDEMKNLESGELSIGVSDTICRYYLMPYLQNFLNKYPKIKLQVFNRTSTQICILLEKGEIDIGIASLPVADKLFVVKQWKTVEDIFIASPKNPVFADLINTDLNIKELAKFPLLLLDKNSTTRKNLDGFFSKYSLVIAPELQLESMDLLLEFAKLGTGIAHVLDKSAEKAINSGELFKLNLLPPPPIRSLGIIYMNNFPLSQAAQKFVELLESQ